MSVVQGLRGTRVPDPPLLSEAPVSTVTSPAAAASCATASSSTPSTAARDPQAARKMDLMLNCTGLPLGSGVPRAR